MVVNTEMERSEGVMFTPLFVSPFFDVFFFFSVTGFLLSGLVCFMHLQKTLSSSKGMDLGT